MELEEKSDEPEKLSKSFKDNIIQVSATISINIYVYKGESLHAPLLPVKFPLFPCSLKKIPLFPGVS